MITEKTTREEIKDNILSIFEEYEDKLVSYTSQIEKIEDDAIELFDRKVIEIKNRLINDTNVSDEDLSKKYLEEIELVRKSVLEDVENKVKELVGSQN